MLFDLKCDTLSEFYRSYRINNQYFLDNFDSRKVIKIWENYRSCGLIVQTRVALKRKERRIPQTEKSSLELRHDIFCQWNVIIMVYAN